jgi:hypothetical protein
MARASIKTCIKNQALISLGPPSIKTGTNFYLLFDSCNAQWICTGYCGRSMKANVSKTKTPAPCGGIILACHMASN